MTDGLDNIAFAAGAVLAAAKGVKTNAERHEKRLTTMRNSAQKKIDATSKAKIKEQEKKAVGLAKAAASGTGTTANSGPCPLLELLSTHPVRQEMHTFKDAAEFASATVGKKFDFDAAQPYIVKQTTALQDHCQSYRFDPPWSLGLRTPKGLSLGEFRQCD